MRVAAEAGDHTSSKSRSPPEPDTAAINCCCDTGRATIDATDNTGKPNPSANSTDTADGPDGAIRARTADAPAACNDTPCHENGKAIRRHHRERSLPRAAPRPKAPDAHRIRLRRRPHRAV